MAQSTARGGVSKRTVKDVSSVAGEHEVFLAMNRTDQRYQTLRFLLVLPSLAIPILAGIPIAKMFAGHQTSVNISLTATLGITLAGVAVVAAMVIRNQQRTIAELRRDNKALRGGLRPPSSSGSGGGSRKP